MPDRSYYEPSDGDHAVINRVVADLARATDDERQRAASIHRRLLGEAQSRRDVLLRELRDVDRTIWLRTTMISILDPKEVSGD